MLLLFPSRKHLSCYKRDQVQWVSVKKYEADQIPFQIDVCPKYYLVNFQRFNKKIFTSSTYIVLFQIKPSECLRHCLGFSQSQQKQGECHTRLTIRASAKYFAPLSSIWLPHRLNVVIVCSTCERQKDIRMMWLTHLTSFSFNPQARNFVPWDPISFRERFIVVSVFAQKQVRASWTDWSKNDLILYWLQAVHLCIWLLVLRDYSIIYSMWVKSVNQLKSNLVGGSKTKEYSHSISS